LGLFRWISNQSYFKPPDKAVILRACDFFDLFRVISISNQLFPAPDKAVILSEALRRSIANRGLYGAESKDLGGAYLHPCCSELFTTEAAPGGPATVFPLTRNAEPALGHRG
jgi:hypothetical protein